MHTAVKNTETFPVADSEPQPQLSLIHHLLERAAIELPDGIAVRVQAKVLTFAQLSELSARWGSWLERRGVRRGGRIVAAVEPGISSIALIYGASRIGVAVAPVDPQLPLRRFHEVIDDTRPSLVLIEEKSQRPGGAVSIMQAEAEVRDTVAAQASSVVIDSDVILLMYTSGSTSKAKAVVSPHRSVVFAVQAIGSCLKYQRSDTVYCAVPFCFDYGLYQTFLCVAAQCTMAIGSSTVSAGILAEIVACGATVVPLVPSLASAVVHLAQRRPPRGNRVRSFTFTGAAVPTSTRAGLRAAFPGATLTLMFGLTECKRVTILEPDGDLERPETVGRALPGTEIAVVDEGRNRVGPNVVGELIVRGPHVMQGYWNCPDASAGRFRRDEMSGEVVLHTGDFGIIDDDGYFYFRGRRDDIYKQDGVRVSKIEIEAAASDIEGVEAAVVVEPRETRPAVLLAITRLSAQEVIIQLRLRIEPRKVPKDVRAVTRIPLLVNGKVDRNALSLMIE